MNRDSWVFCTVALALALLAGAVGFRFAALSPEALAAARTPTPAERLPDVDLGPGFGPVPVLELLGYYIENPPAPAGGSAEAAVKRFGGC